LPCTLRLRRKKTASTTIAIGRPGPDLRGPIVGAGGVLLEHGVEGGQGLGLAHGLGICEARHHPGLRHRLPERVLVAGGGVAGEELRAVLDEIAEVAALGLAVHVRQEVRVREARPRDEHALDLGDLHRPQQCQQHLLVEPLQSLRRPRPWDTHCAVYCLLLA
jgi:hypothetical protein